jgi:hypothetical protein
MAAVRHPNVVQVYHYGEHAGRPFLALELCHGGSLDARLKAGRLPPTEAANLLAAISGGVAAAHTAGIVHRDLKPHNVLLTADGNPKVTDFGLAKLNSGSELTKTTAIMGTPAYMPPEQARGETKFVGPPADVWALGVILYEALTGTRPFTGADHWAILAAVQRGTFPPPRSVVKDIPRDLELVCLKCLKAEPHERYPTAKELAADLQAWVDGRPIRARPTGLVESAVKWARRNRRLAAMGAAVFLTMAVATGVSLAFGAEADRQANTARKLESRVRSEADEVRTQKRRADAAISDAQQAGALIVTDRDKLQIRSLPTTDFGRKQFAWWVFVPVGQKYVMKIAWGKVPRNDCLYKTPQSCDVEYPHSSPKEKALDFQQTGRFTIDIARMPVELTGRTGLYQVWFWKKVDTWHLDRKYPASDGVWGESTPTSVDCSSFEQRGGTRRTFDVSKNGVAAFPPGADKFLLIHNVHLAPIPEDEAFRMSPDQRDAKASAMPVVSGIMIWLEKAD